MGRELGQNTQKKKTKNERAEGKKEDQGGRLSEAVADGRGYKKHRTRGNKQQQKKKTGGLFPCWTEEEWPGKSIQ